MTVSQLLLIMSVALPLLSAILLTANQARSLSSSLTRSVATIASVFTCALALFSLAAAAVPSHEILEFKQINFNAINDIFGLPDELSPLQSCWLFMNSISTGLLTFGMRRKQGSSHRLQMAPLFCLFTVANAIVITDDLRWQWFLLGLSNWIVYACVFPRHSHAENLPNSRQMVIYLTLADSFWMMGLLGMSLMSSSSRIGDILLTTESFRENPAAIGLLTTSAVSMLISIAIRLAFFPMMSWTRNVPQSAESLICLLAFPISLGGFLYFRWNSILLFSPEPATLLLGIAGLSALLLTLTALFQTGLQRRFRLGSLPLTLAILGVAIRPELSPQMVSLFCGGIIFTSTLILSGSTPFSGMRSAHWFTWIFGGLLWCSTFGSEVIFRTLFQATSTDTNGVDVPNVMLPLMVLSLGLFAYGLYECLKETTPEPTHKTNWGSLAIGSLAMLTILSFPFLLAGSHSYQFQFPIISVAVLITGALVANLTTARDLDSPPELSSLSKLCSNEYHLETILDRGIVIPIEIAAALAHFFDRYILKSVLVTIPEWIQKEVIDSTQLMENGSTTSMRLQWIILSLAVMLGALYITH